jgi:hypothetical protein
VIAVTVGKTVASLLTARSSLLQAIELAVPLVPQKLLLKLPLLQSR